MESGDKEVIIQEAARPAQAADDHLKRGKNNSMELWAWHEAVLQR